MKKLKRTYLRSGRVIGAVLLLLMIVGSIWDLPISKFLYPGRESSFGQFFAAFGELPAFLAMTSAGVLLFFNRKRLRKSWNVLFLAASAVLVAGGIVLSIHEARDNVPAMPLWVAALVTVFAAALAGFLLLLGTEGCQTKTILRFILVLAFISIGMMIVQAVVNPFGTQALAGYAATMRVENVFSLIFVSIGNAVSPYISQNLGAKKIDRLKKGYHAALVLDLCFAVIAFAVIETLHTQISSLFLGKDGTALAYQVSGDYMRWLGYFFIFMGIKMATDGVLRGLGIMRPFLIANMVNLAIRLSVALICAPRFGIAFVWLAVPAGWLANFLVSYAALRRSWPTENAAAPQ